MSLDISGALDHTQCCLFFIKVLLYSGLEKTSHTDQYLLVDCLLCFLLVLLRFSFYPSPSLPPDLRPFFLSFFLVLADWYTDIILCLCVGIYKKHTKDRYETLTES